MRKGALLLTFTFFVFCAVTVNAEEYGQKSKGSAGVEVKKSGGANVLAPKGSKLIKKEGATFVEGLREYTSRKFSEVENRLRIIETENAQLKSSVEELKKSVSSLQKALLVSTQKEPVKQTDTRPKE